MGKAFCRKQAPPDIPHLDCVLQRVTATTTPNQTLSHTFGEEWKKNHRSITGHEAIIQTRFESGSDRQIPSTTHEVSQEQCREQKQKVQVKPNVPAQENHHQPPNTNHPGTFFPQGHLHGASPS